MVLPSCLNQGPSEEEWRDLQQELLGDGQSLVDDREKLLHLWRKLQRTEHALRGALQEVKCVQPSLVYHPGINTRAYHQLTFISHHPQRIIITKHSVNTNVMSLTHFHFLEIV